MRRASRAGLKLPALGDRDSAARVAASTAVVGRDAASLAGEIERLLAEQSTQLGLFATQVVDGLSAEEALALADKSAHGRLEEAEQAAQAAAAEVERAAAEVSRLREAQASLSRMAAAVLPLLTVRCARSVRNKLMRTNCGLTFDASRGRYRQLQPRGAPGSRSN